MSLSKRVSTLIWGTPAKSSILDECAKRVADSASITPDVVLRIIEAKEQELLPEELEHEDGRSGLWSYRHLSLVSIDKLAGFDLDDTLLKRFSTEVTSPNVKPTLERLREEGWTLVIFSNQLGVSQKKETIEGINIRINKLFDHLGFKCSVFVATEDNKYRKPLPEMWKEATRGKVVSQALYVGDAAGRKGDFSTSDAMFAHNGSLVLDVEVKFVTAEDFFRIATKKPKEITKNPYTASGEDGFNPKPFVRDVVVSPVRTVDVDRTIIGVLTEMFDDVVVYDDWKTTYDEVYRVAGIPQHTISRNIVKRLLEKMKDSDPTEIYDVVDEARTKLMQNDVLDFFYGQTY